jgi:hypothetical protein
MDIREIIVGTVLLGSAIVARDEKLARGMGEVDIGDARRFFRKLEPKIDALEAAVRAIYEADVVNDEGSPYRPSCVSYRQAVSRAYVALDEVREMTRSPMFSLLMREKRYATDIQELSRVMNEAIRGIAAFERSSEEIGAKGCGRARPKSQGGLGRLLGQASMLGLALTLARR